MPRVVEFSRGVVTTMLGASAATLIAAVLALPFILIVGNAAMDFGAAEDAAEGLAMVSYLGFTTVLIAIGIAVALHTLDCGRVTATALLFAPTAAAALVLYASLLDRTGFEPAGPFVAVLYATLVLFAAAAGARVLASIPLPATRVR